MPLDRRLVDRRLHDHRHGHRGVASNASQGPSRFTDFGAHPSAGLRRARFDRMANQVANELFGEVTSRSMVRSLPSETALMVATAIDRFTKQSQVTDNTVHAMVLPERWPVAMQVAARVAKKAGHVLQVVISDTELPMTDLVPLAFIVQRYGE